MKPTINHFVTSFTYIACVKGQRQDQPEIRYEFILANDPVKAKDEGRRRMEADGWPIVIADCVVRTGEL